MQVDHVKPDLSKVKIQTQRYDASGGKEFFIAAEDPVNNVLLGYLRMRIPSPKAHRPEITEVPSAIVRELHVYGQLVPVGKHEDSAVQHRGYGKDLLAEAERIARDRVWAGKAFSHKCIRNKTILHAPRVWARRSLRFKEAKMT